MSSAKKAEWLCIIPDVPGTLEQRMAVRPKHFEGLTSRPHLKFGGAMLDAPPVEGSALKINGSTVTVEASTREEVVEYLKQDIYATSGVWDVEKATIIPFITGVRKPM